MFNEFMKMLDNYILLLLLFCKSHIISETFIQIFVGGLIEIGRCHVNFFDYLNVKISSIFLF